MAKRKRLSDAVLRQAIDQLLEESIPIPEIRQQTVFRTEDDCDGEHHLGLQLIMGSDGDIHLTAFKRGGSMRFRNRIGGTASPYTHNALRLLMLAMIRDGQPKR